MFSRVVAEMGQATGYRNIMNFDKKEELPEWLMTN
jgi:hypothetical protein